MCLFLGGLALPPASGVSRLLGHWPLPILRNFLSVWPKPSRPSCYCEHTGVGLGERVNIFFSKNIFYFYQGPSGTESNTLAHRGPPFQPEVWSGSCTSWIQGCSPLLPQTGEHVEPPLGSPPGSPWRCSAVVQPVALHLLVTVQQLLKAHPLGSCAAQAWPVDPPPAPTPLWQAPPVLCAQRPWAGPCCHGQTSYLPCVGLSPTCPCKAVQV